MVVQARPAFSTLGFSWILQKTWDPTHGKFGLLPFILGTLETTAIAVVLAVPIGLGTAISLAYLVPHRVRAGLATAVELLAAVPSVVYGLWGLIVLAPLFREHVEPFLTSVFGWTGLFGGTPQRGRSAAGRSHPVRDDPAHHGGHLAATCWPWCPTTRSRGPWLSEPPAGRSCARWWCPEPAPASSAPSPWPPGGPWVRRWPWPWSSATPPTSPTRSTHRAATIPSLIVNNFGESNGTELSALFGAGLVLLVIGVAVNATARVLVRSAARNGGGADPAAAAASVAVA